MIKDKDAKIIKSILGDDIFDTLKKYEIFKPETRTVVDPAEIKIALEIVPRSVLSFLFSNLKDKQIGDTIDLELPFVNNSKLLMNKAGNDSYSGEIIKDGKRISEFKYRSLPSVGLILLTTFELYDTDLLNEIKENLPNNETKENLYSKAYDSKVNRLQDIIDERLSLNKLVNGVLSRELSYKDAIDNLIREKLNNDLFAVNNNPIMRNRIDIDPLEENKKSKLRLFLENRERKRQQTIDSFDKAEIVCPDCSGILFKNENKNKIKLCLCFGEHMGKKISFKKTENGQIKFNFPKTFDIDNIEMLLEAFKNHKED